MPEKPKKQTPGRFVEINLKIAKRKFPLVSEALKAVMALVGQRIRLKPVKPRAAKTAKKKGSGSSPRQPGATRRAEKKIPASPETAALIRDLRTKAGLSQKALAEKIGASQNQVSLLETAKQGLKPAWAKKLGRLFGTPIPAE